ncbi:NUDIX domain-containing protein [Nocardiopsis flavescens]|uniref:NUDIX hydrolase n=1 Tax=Nocardiopsis flavescens TaxID=758803 RepID=UPI003646246E
MPVPEFLRELRDQIGPALLPLTGVTGVVLDEDDNVLLHRRADDGRWATPGGILEPGEQPAAAVVREVWEETGLVVAVERLVSVVGQDPYVYPNGDRVQFLDLAFRCRPVGGAPDAGGDETLEVGWFAPDALPAMSDSIMRRIGYARESRTEPFYVL